MPTPFDLMVAPNGARLGKADHPALPISTSELAETARACAAAGANAIHLHVRNENGAHSLDPELYRAAMTEISALCDIRLQISTEAVGIFEVAEQIACVAGARAPEASIALREIERDPENLGDIYRLAERIGTGVQHILYSDQDLIRLLAHMEDGVIPAQMNRVLFVLGRYVPGQRSTPEELDPFLAAMGQAELHWSVCAFGPAEQDCLLAALRKGGNARIGFENNRIAPDGRPFRDNAEAVQTFVEAAAREGFIPRKS